MENEIGRDFKNTREEALHPVVRGKYSCKHPGSYFDEKHN